MNATARAAIDMVPIPVEGGRRVEASVTTDETGAWRLQWNHEGGRRHELFGPAYSLREALDAAARLNERAWGA